MKASSINKPLLFGNDKSVVFTNPFDLAKAVEPFVTHLVTEHPSHCLYKYSEIKVNDIKVTSEILTTTQVGAVINSYSLLLGLEGHYSVNQRGKTYQTQKDVALILPPTENIPFASASGKTTQGLLINFDLKRLNQTSQIMCGKKVDELALQTLKLKNDFADFNRLFLRWIDQVDAFSGRTDLLRLQGFDDQAYRLLTMMLYPRSFKTDRNTIKKEIKTTEGFIKAVEAFIADHLESPVNITHLQHTLGISARSLQYGFIKAFGCSPRQYIYNQKLDRAYELLTQDSQDLTLLQISEQLGFSSQSRFSKFFAQRFGCKPSELHQKRVIGSHK